MAPTHAGLTTAALEAQPDGIVVGPGSLAFPATAVTPARPDGVAGGRRLRLVVTRKLYDAAVLTTRSPALAPLAPGARLHVHPRDLERIGAAAGTAVRVTSGNRSLVLVLAPDAAVLPGTAWVPFNQPDAAVGDLIDATAPVTDIVVDVL